MLLIERSLQVKLVLTVGEMQKISQQLLIQNYWFGEGGNRMANGNVGGAGNAPRASNVPTRKVSAGALAGALSIILVWGINRLLPNDNQLEPAVASAITTVMTFLVGYFIPEPA
jgi:hypothetical protein